MKESQFRRLTRAELEEVRDQFVRFLGVNGIDAGSWEKMKIDQPARADAYLLQFSQIVYAGVIAKVRYLIRRSRNDIRTFRIGPDKIEMRGLLVVGDTELDLTDTDTSPQDMLISLRRDGAKLRLYSAERPYREVGREQDIFLLMEGGALIDPGSFFETLAEL